MIGVITGLRAEARCLRGLDVAIACSGARPERAWAEAARLLAGGATGLLSFGLAAGLAPDLRPGDLVLAETVVLPDGRRLATAAAWRSRVAAALERAGIATHAGPLAGTGRLLTSPGQKQALHEATGAVAADMESHVVAELASAAGKPFIVVRAVSDPAGQGLPEAALHLLGEQGQILPAALVRLIARPRDLLGLLRLGRQSRRAFGALGQAARSAGRTLERPFTRPGSESECASPGP